MDGRKNYMDIFALQELPLVLNVDDAARILRVGKAATYSLVRSGQLKALRIGRTIRIPRHALGEYLQSIH